MGVIDCDTHVDETEYVGVAGRDQAGVQTDDRLSAPPGSLPIAHPLLDGRRPPTAMRYTGEDHLLVGSDYTHPDPSGEMDFAQLLQRRADQGDIPQSAVQRITGDNGRIFYGL